MDASRLYLTSGSACASPRLCGCAGAAVPAAACARAQHPLSRPTQLLPRCPCATSPLRDRPVARQLPCGLACPDSPPPPILPTRPPTPDPVALTRTAPIACPVASPEQLKPLAHTTTTTEDRDASRRGGERGTGPSCPSSAEGCQPSASLLPAVMGVAACALLPSSLFAHSFSLLSMPLSRAADAAARE